MKELARKCRIFTLSEFLRGFCNWILNDLAPVRRAKIVSYEKCGIPSFSSLIWTQTRQLVEIRQYITNWQLGQSQKSSWQCCTHTFVLSMHKNNLSEMTVWNWERNKLKINQSREKARPLQIIFYLHLVSTHCCTTSRQKYISFLLEAATFLLLKFILRAWVSMSSLGGFLTSKIICNIWVRSLGKTRLPWLEKTTGKITPWDLDALFCRLLFQVTVTGLENTPASTAMYSNANAGKLSRRAIHLLSKQKFKPYEGTGILELFILPTH